MRDPDRDTTVHPAPGVLKFRRGTSSELHVPPNIDPVYKRRRPPEELREQIDLLLLVVHRTDDHRLDIPCPELVEDLLTRCIGQGGGISLDESMSSPPLN